MVTTRSRKARARKNLKAQKKPHDSDSDSDSDESSASAEESDEHWSEYFEFVGKPHKQRKTRGKGAPVKVYLDAKLRGEKISQGSFITVSTDMTPEEDGGDIAQIVEIYSDKYNDPHLKVEWYWRPETIKKLKPPVKYHEFELWKDEGKYNKTAGVIQPETIIGVARVFTGLPDVQGAFNAFRRKGSKQAKKKFKDGLVFWSNRTYHSKKKRVSSVKPEAPSSKGVKRGRPKSAGGKRKRTSPAPMAAETRASSPVQPSAKRRKINDGSQRNLITGVAAGLQLSGKKRQKKGQVRNWDRNVFIEAKAKLRLSAVPEKLPCREKEHKEIYEFIKNAVNRGGEGSGLYISGMPGTGKTATVRQIISELSREVDSGDIKNPFTYHEINAMKLPTPYHCYSELYFQLKGERVSHQAAVKRLERRFSTHSAARSVAVVLLDELDYLVTQKQSVIYNMFDWPTRRYGRLVMVGIANTMDLPERLTQRVQSRLGKRRITFQPYNRAQIQTIITDRISSLKLFSKHAIRFCAMKVAGVSGDIRRALQIAKRATEIVQKRYEQQPIGDQKKTPDITIGDIKKAAEDLYDSSDVALLKHLRLYERVFVTAMVRYERQTGRHEMSIQDVSVRFDQCCDQKGLKKISDVQIRGITDRLHDVRLVNLEKSKSCSRLVRLNAQVDDIRHSFATCDKCTDLLLN